MKKLFWGLFFIASAAFVIVNQLGYVTDINLFTLVFTILLLPILFKSLVKANFFGIFMSLSVFAILYAKPLGIEAITPFPVLISALLLSIGFSIMFKKNKFIGRKEKFDNIINEQDDSNIEFRVNYGASVKYINSNDFKSAKLSCSFGAMKAYFDNAKIEGDSAVISLDVSFSGVELYIPRDWKVVNKVDVSLGAIEEKTKNNDITTKTVTLVGRVSLSGVEIIYI